LHVNTHITFRMAAKKNPVRNQPASQQAKQKQQAKGQQSKKSIEKTDTSNWYIIPGIIFVLCFILYGNTINHSYVLDDDIYTQKNVYVQQGFSAIKNIFNKGSLYGFNGSNESNYRPLVLLNFMAEVQWFGLNPHVSHFFNVFFFAICCVLLYFLLRRVFSEYNMLIPLTATLLFVFHPIHTEAVANVKSRDEILGLLFGVLSFYFIFLYVEKKKLNLYLASLFAFFCSVLCKENSITFVVIIPLLLYFFTVTDLKRIALLSLPYLGVLGVYMLMRNGALSNITFKDKLDVINNSLMAAKNGSDMFATEFVMMGKYLWMLVVPYPLSWDYSYNQISIVSLTNVKAILSILLYVALGAYVFWSLIRKQKSVYAFSILFYLVTIFLSSNLVLKIGSTFAERLLFVPSLGFCMSLPLLIPQILKINPKYTVWQNKSSFYFITGIVLIVYAYILIPRNQEWKNNLSLFQAGVIVSPNSARTHDALAREYRTQAELSQDPAQKNQLYALSISEFHKAINIYQDADIYYNMGVSFYEDGMQDSALKVYQKAIALSPNYSMASNNLGVIYFNKHMFDSAISYFIKNYNRDTNDVQALSNIGAAYQNLGNSEKAVHYYFKVLNKQPGNGNILNNLTVIYVNSGMQFFNKKDYNNAYNDFITALKYNPNSADALGNIGAVYQAKGDNEKAVEYYQKSLAINPKNAVFSNNLASLRATTQKSAN